MSERSPSHRGKCGVVVDRREFLAGATALTLTAARAQPAPAKYRVAVIGHSGRGNYGHGLDRVWLEVPGVEIVGVADAEGQGLAQAVKRLGAPAGFADYRRMLERVKPDLVAIGPRWVDQHRDMLTAAANCGARGIYMEKPMCRTLAEADEMVAACQKNKVKFAIAYQTRYSPKLPIVRELITSGKIGQVLEFRGRGKEDRRGGGEDLWVLGTHVFNLIHHLGGQPTECFARVLQDGRPIRKADVKPGSEGIGPLAGDEIHAMYRLSDGASAYFDTIRNAGGSPSRFGLRIFGSAGVIEMHTGYLPAVYLLGDSSWSPGRTGKSWVPVSSAGVGQKEPLAGGGLHEGNLLAVRDLIAAIEEDRQPQASILEARTAMEMIAAVFESQRVGGPVSVPLAKRKNPLAELG